MQNDSNLNNSIVFKDVTKQYKGTMQPALSHINLSVKKGEFVCLVGPSGEGKSTLLKLIAGLEKETEGVIEKPEVVSMAFQTIALFPWLSVFDNVAIGLQTKGVVEKEVHKETMKYIHMMNLDMFVDQKPADLSGGQRQRVGIARALAVNPDVLLLDEPFSALDPKTTAELHDDIIRIWKETGKTIVMVSHLIEEAVSLAERIFLIKQGELAHTFTIDLPYPRRDQEEHFMHEVGKVRKEFFK